MRVSNGHASQSALVGLQRSLALAAVAIALAACDDGGVTSPGPLPGTLADEVRLLAAQNDIGPLQAAFLVRAELVELGQALVFDKILSDQGDVSCMTCHLPSFGTSDGINMSIGVGATGLGPDRAGGVIIPRNALPLFNFHAMRVQFWDGRLEQLPGGGLRSPAGDDLTADMIRVFEFGPISALGLFPVLSREEMRGFVGNELAAIADEDIPEIWQALMARFAAIPEYPAMFEAAYPGTPFEQMTLAHASNAMAGFFIDRLTFNDTPWDRFLAGNDDALTEQQLLGARTFLSDGRCVTCHRGAGLTDERFHNTALAQFGPGQGDGPAGNDDHGRYRITGETHLLYAYRTPPLRNVELTGPFGHVGQFTELRDFVSHYSRSDEKLRDYDAGQVDPVHHGTLVNNVNEILETRDPLLDGLVLSETQIDQLVEFLHALTDDRARNLDGIAPGRVPSGLPVDR